MTRVPFFWVDVFADEPLTGNPVAVIPDADQLDASTMRAIAREFNQSETTFIVSPSGAGVIAAFRSFTPAGDEVGGCGHNVLGAALWLVASENIPEAAAGFDVEVGGAAVRIRVETAGPRPRVGLTQGRPRFLARLTDTGDLAAALGLRSQELAVSAPEVVSTGVAHLLVPLPSRRTVDEVTPRTAELGLLLATVRAEGCYVYSTEDKGDDVAAYARFFNPTVGIVEDPATGTAAGPLAALLVRDGPASSTGFVTILQGVRLGRPSRLLLRAGQDGVELAGAGVVAGEGTLFL